MSVESPLYEIQQLSSIIYYWSSFRYQNLVIFSQVKNSGKQVFGDDSKNTDERGERVQF